MTPSANLLSYEKPGRSRGMLSSFVFADDFGKFFPFLGCSPHKSPNFSSRGLFFVNFLKLEWIGNPVRSFVRTVMMQPQLRGNLCVVIPEVKVPIPQ